jgi:hypothetical protein
MGFQTTFERRAGYLRVKASGEFPTLNLREGVTSILKQAVKSGYTRVLIDAYDVSAPKSDIDRFDAGTTMAELFRGRLKVAILYPPELINKLAEDAAVNRGADVLVVHDEKVALRWLFAKDD